MPYFKRKPVDGLVDAALSSMPIPGLPSRSRTSAGATGLDVRPFHPVTTATGIVEEAAAVLASERPGAASPAVSARSDAGPTAATQSVQASQLQEQLNRLVEQFVTLAIRPPSPDVVASVPATALRQSPSADSASVVEPAPVLAPPGPVAPGSTAQISISLVNEDDQLAQIVFCNTGLIGEDDHISAEHVSFQPRELMLSPGKTGEVIVRVAVPAQTRCGAYSGLVRASKLDYLHAVLVVQVECP